MVKRIDSPPKFVSMTGPVVHSEPELVVPAKAVLPDKMQPRDARTAMFSKAGSRNVGRSLNLAETSEGKDDGRDGKDPKTLVKMSETTVPLRLTKEPRPVAPAKDVLSLASTVQPAQDDGTSSLEAGVTVAAANRAGVTTDKAAATVALPAAVLAKKEARREWAVAMGKSSAGKVGDSTHRPEDQALRTCHLCNQQKSGHMRRHLRLGHQLCNEEIDELLVRWKQMAAGPAQQVANEKALTCPYCRQPQTRLKRHLQVVHKLSDPHIIKDRLMAAALLRPQSAGESDGRPLDLFKSVMTGFEAFLTSRGGYVYKPSIAKDLVQKVKTILSFIMSPSVFTLARLGDLQRYGDKGGILEQVATYKHSSSGAMERREKPLGAGTMSNYVLALKRFCEFLHGRQDRVLAIVSDLHSWATLTQHINRVYTTYNVEKTKEQAMRRIDQSQLLDGLTVWGYTTSDLAVRVNEILLSAATPLDLTVEAYTLVRGHILMLLEILNGKRAGDFRNLTMQEWQEGTMVGIDYIVRVRRHKVITKPCNINFPGLVYNYMKRFIKYYRPIVLKKGVDTENVFLGTTGSQLTSSQIVDAMNKCWQIYGCEIGEQLPRFTTTRARKLIVTIHRSTSQTKASQDDLAAHMAHSPAVADR